MRVLVIGGTGLVGNALVRAWAAAGSEVAAATYHCHPSPDFRQLDMQDEAAVRRALADTRPELVAVPAANPHVDYCELHPAETRRINVDGTLAVARACAAAGARMIFFSSDYVFDGSRPSYKEEDAVGPIQEYGRQKARAEAGVLGCSARNMVVRTAGAYGWQWEPKNFVLQVKASLEAGRPFKAPHDVFYNPTAVENLAAVVVELAARGAGGIFHVVGSERVSKLEFARRVCAAWGLDAAKLEAVSSAQFNPPAKRPPSSTLLTGKVRALVSTPLWGVDEGLRRMKEQEPAWREYAKRLPVLSSKSAA